MDNQIMTWLMTNVSFGALFVWLLVDTRKDSKQREEKYQATIEKYQSTIDKLADKFSIVEDMKEDLEDIKTKLD